MAADPATATIPIRAGAVPLAVPPFAGWSYTDAAEAVAALVPDDYEVRRDYAHDRHWRGGDGYIGPRPLSGDPDASAKMAQAERQFAPYDACGEGLNAVEDAFSAEAQIGFDALEAVPEDDDMPEETRQRGEEAIGILTELWDRVRLQEQIKPAIRTAAWAERAVLRWWIPPGRALRVVDGESERIVLPRAGSIEEAAEWLALSRPDPESAGIVTDEATQARAAVYLDEVRGEGESKINRAQIAYADGGALVIRTVYEGAEWEGAEDRHENGGVLPMAEMRGGNLLTPSVIATQQQLDYVESIVTTAAETGGFPERYIGNAEPSGERRLLGPGEDPRPGTYLWEHDGQRIEVNPGPRPLGARITTELVGIVTHTEDGKVARATPSVERFEPVDPEFAIKSGRHARAKILRMMRQGHRVGDGTGEASGIAYQQDRAAFEKDLQNRKGSAEGALRELLTSALAWIEVLAGVPGYFTSLIRVTVDMHVDAGPRSPDERNQDRADVEAGLLSPATAMARGGIEDIEAESQRIHDSPLSRLLLLEKAAAVYAQIAQAASAEAAVRALVAAGVDPKIAEALRALDTDGVGVAL